MLTSEAKNRVRLYLKNKQYCESRGYTLLPSNKERQSLKLLKIDLNNTNTISPNVIREKQ